MIPIEFFYLSSLAIYAFFVFFAFFVYKRSGKRPSGKLASLALLSMALYVGSAVLMYDMVTMRAHLVAWWVGFAAGLFAVAIWMHMIIKLEAERNGAGSRLSPVPKMAVSAAYVAAGLLSILGGILPGPLGNLLFKMNDYAPAPWPFCQWTHYFAGPGPYYFTVGLYILLCLIYMLSRLSLAAYKAHRSVERAASIAEAREQLSARNEQLWLLTATLLLAGSGIFMSIMVALGVQMPETVAHAIVAMGGLIIGMVIVRHTALVAERNVAPDFYRSLVSIVVITSAIILALYFGESGEVSKATLLVMVTVAIVFFVNIDNWWKFTDNLFLGPQVARDRARVRHVLEDSAPDPELMRIKITYANWSNETKRIFMLLGEGMSRRSVSAAVGLHLSTVDLHIRRIKDDLENDRLEDVRSLAHKLLIYMRITQEDQPVLRT